MLRPYEEPHPLGPGVRLSLACGWNTAGRFVLQGISVAWCFERIKTRYTHVLGLLGHYTWLVLTIRARASPKYIPIPSPHRSFGPGKVTQTNSRIICCKKQMCVYARHALRV